MSPLRKDQTIDLSLYTCWWMVKGEGRIAFLTLAGLAGLASLARTHFGTGEENRAKDAKDAKVKGKKDEEIAGVVVEGAFALRIQMPCR